MTKLIVNFIQSSFVLLITLQLSGSVPSSGLRSSGEYGFGKVKGDLEDFSEILTVAPASWENFKPKIEKEEVQMIFRNKGDEAVIDPRGTVRYHILPSGRISKGIVTSWGDEESKSVRAKDNCCQADKYGINLLKESTVNE